MAVKMERSTFKISFLFVFLVSISPSICVRHHHHSYHDELNFGSDELHAPVSEEAIENLMPEGGALEDGEEIIIVVTAENSIENRLGNDIGHAVDDNEMNRPCNCGEQLTQIQERMNGLEKELKMYKDSELERFYKLSKRVKYIVDGLTNGKEEQAQIQMKFLADHIWEEDVLQRVSELVLTAAANNPEFNSSMLRSALTVAFPKKTNVQVLTAFFEYLDQGKKLQNMEILRTFVLVLTRALIDAEPSSTWTKEVEVKLLNRILVNVCATMESHLGPWVDLKFWINCNFFQAFRHLSEREAVEVALDTIQTYNDGMLSTLNQLRYLKILYHDCSTEEGLIHRHYWSTVDVFNSSFILSSIDQEILSFNGSSNDATEVGLLYFEQLARDWNEALEDEYFVAENLLFSRMAEVFLHAMQSNAMTFDSERPEFWRLIKVFDPLTPVLTKYSFLAEEVKMAIVGKYGDDINRIEMTIDFIQEVPKTFAYISYKQLLSSMREKGHFHSPEIFRLAAIFMALGLRNDTIWSEVPEQVQLISDYSTDKGLIWTARTINNSYEVFAGEDDLVLRLKPLHSEAEMGPHRIWIFDPVSSIKGTAKITITLADFMPPHFGGVVVATQDETPLLRHIGGVRDRKNGKFAYLVPQLSESLDAVQLFFNGEPIGILYDPEGQADGLGIGNPPSPVDFVLIREV